MSKTNSREDVAREMTEFCAQRCAPRARRRRAAATVQAVSLAVQRVVVSSFVIALVSRLGDGSSAPWRG